MFVPVVLRGVERDARGNAQIGALVQLRLRGGSTVSVLTDRQGRYHLAVPLLTPHGQLEEQEVWITPAGGAASRRLIRHDPETGEFAVREP